MKPVIAISMGDPSGISPEVVAASLEDALLVCRPVIFGHRPTLEQSIKLTGCALELKEGIPQEGEVAFVECGSGYKPIDEQGIEGARVQFDALERAVDSVFDGTCEAIVTAPVSKALVSMVHKGFTGHTEYLAKRANVADDDVTMVFASDALMVGLVSTHLSMKEVPAAVNKRTLGRTADHLEQMLHALHPNRAVRLAVAALNPHAGEEGLLGKEEREIIEPFCNAISQRPNLKVFGPLPADTIYRDALRGNYDGVIATYHDQAMIPLKLHGVGATVNVTWGLGFVRTSPDHGVAYDIARKGVADPSGMTAAIRLAVKLTLKGNSDAT